jgi:Mg-chelatase subunit ChlD
MTGHPSLRRSAFAVLTAAVALLTLERGVSGQEGFKFKSGVELINVTATVIDRTGRFATGLRKEDFLVYDDDKLVEVTHFSAERTPVSLGIVLDTSGSMAGEKIESARSAIFNFLQALPDPDDEFFMYRFNADATLVHDWTNSREAISRILGRINPSGGTAMYDAVGEAVPMAHGGRNRKKAIVLISDGNDTNSRIDVSDVKQLVRETEVLVYAVGIDGQGEPTIFNRPTPPIKSVSASRRQAPRRWHPVPHSHAVAAWRQWRRQHLTRHGRPRERGGVARDHRRQRRANRNRPRSSRSGSGKL